MEAESLGQITSSESPRLLGEHAGFISGLPITRGTAYAHSLIRTRSSLFIVFSTVTCCRVETRGLNFNLHRPPASHGLAAPNR